MRLRIGCIRNGWAFALVQLAAKPAANETVAQWVWRETGCRVPTGVNPRDAATA